MRLGEEIFHLLGGEDPARISYTVTDGGSGYFRNVKRLLEFSPVKIVLAGRKGGVAVEGEDLSLGKYCAGDLVICGEIACVKRKE